MGLGRFWLVVSIGKIDGLSNAVFEWIVGIGTRYHFSFLNLIQSRAYNLGFSNENVKLDTFQMQLTNIPIFTHTYIAHLLTILK